LINKVIAFAVALFFCLILQIITDPSMLLRCFILNILFICLLVFHLEAQTEPNTVDSVLIETEDERNKPLGDSTPVYYFSFSETNPKFIDTSLQDFEIPNPGWKKRNSYVADLGHLGTAQFPLLWESSTKAGFRSGMDMFDYMRLRVEEIPFYEIGGKRPFTDLYYSQINLQNVQLKANFAHQILPALYYSVHYAILNYNGYFKGQRSRHQDVALNFRYSKNKYKAHFIFISNNNNQSENGGLTLQTLGLNDLLFLVNQPVALNVQNDGSPKHENKHQTLHFRQYFNNKAASPNSSIGHHFNFENNIYKYFDKNPESDSAYYGNFQTNNRGIRHYIRHRLAENELNWRQAFGGTLDKSPLILKLALSHSFNEIFQQPQLFYVNNFAATVQLYENIDGAFKYNAALKIVNSRLGLDFWLKADLSYAIKDYVKVGGNILYQRYEPTQTSRQFYVSGTRIWENNNSLKQIEEFSLQAYLAWPKFWGKFEIKNHSIGRAVYYDTAAIVRQMPGSANIMQLILRQDLHVWKFHLENEAVWQRVISGNAVFRLPELLLRHKLYFESKVFKTVKLRTGVSFRYMSSYYANAYFPILGVFHLQNEQLMKFYPQADIFISAKIWQMRFFVNAENLTYYLNGWQNYFTAPYYPTPNWFVRLGLSWQIFD
jgi:hypothetical protein